MRRGPGMKIDRRCSLIAAHALRCLEDVPSQQADRLCRWLQAAAPIFCAAQGRSGYILRCFCMRLMHMGYCAHFAGDTVTPPIGEGGLLVVLSGSGRTSCTCSLVERAKSAGGRTFGILGTKYSPMEEHLDAVIHIPVVPVEEAGADDEPLVQALGSPFEQAAFLLLEGVSHALFVRHGSDQRMLQQRHTNLE